jgi:hypothetical protein
MIRAAPGRTIVRISFATKPKSRLNNFSQTFTKPKPRWKESQSNASSDLSGPGTRSEGLRMKAFPVPIAIGSIQSTIIAGKLNGAIPATTPSG